MSNNIYRLYRSRSARMIAGVCGGLGSFFGLDATVMRLIFVLLAIFWPPMIVLYLIMMLVVPEEPLPESTDLTNPETESQDSPAEGRD